MSALINENYNNNNNDIETSEPLEAKRDQVPSSKTSQKHSNIEPSTHNHNPSSEEDAHQATGFFEGIYNKVVSYFPNFSLFSPSRSDNKVYSNVDEIVEADSKAEQRQELFDQIKAHRVPLNHVDTEEKNVDLHPRQKILKQITESSPSLAHVETNDKSSPVLPEQVNLNKLDTKPLLSDIVSPPHHLRHVSEVSDRSNPMIPNENVNLHKIDHKRLLDEIVASAK